MKKFYTLSERIALAMKYGNKGFGMNQSELARRVKEKVEKQTGEKSNIKPQTIQSIMQRGSENSSYLPYIAEVCGVDPYWLINESRDVLDGEESGHPIIESIRERMGYKQNTMQLPAPTATGTSVSINPNSPEFEAINGLSELLRLYLTMSPAKQQFVLEQARQVHGLQ